MKETVASREKVIDKVHSTLKSLNIPISRYDYVLNNLRNIIYEFSESLKWNRVRVSNIDDNLSDVRKGE